MPDKHSHDERHGGPGSAHQNLGSARPAQSVKDADAPDHLSPRSQISGGGGENDIHQRHNAEAKRHKQASSQEKKHEADGRRPA